jgi:hypothetical protein
MIKPASMGTIVNTGRAAHYPTFRLRNLGGGLAQVFTVVKVAAIEHFNLNAAGLSGECISIIMRGGHWWYVSPYRHLMRRKIRRGCK